MMPNLFESIAQQQSLDEEIQQLKQQLLEESFVELAAQEQALAQLKETKQQLQQNTYANLMSISELEQQQKKMQEQLYEIETKKSDVRSNLNTVGLTAELDDIEVESDVQQEKKSPPWWRRFWKSIVQIFFGRTSSRGVQKTTGVVSQTSPRSQTGTSQRERMEQALRDLELEEDDLNNKITEYQKTIDRQLKENQSNQTKLERLVREIGELEQKLPVQQVKQRDQLVAKQERLSEQQTQVRQELERLYGDVDRKIEAFSQAISSVEQHLNGIEDTLRPAHQNDFNTLSLMQEIKGIYQTLRRDPMQPQVADLERIQEGLKNRSGLFNSCKQAILDLNQFLEIKITPKSTSLDSPVAQPDEVKPQEHQSSLQSLYQSLSSFFSYGVPSNRSLKKPLEPVDTTVRQSSMFQPKPDGLLQEAKAFVVQVEDKIKQLELSEPNSSILSDLKKDHNKHSDLFSKIKQANQMTLEIETALKQTGIFDYLEEQQRQRNSPSPRKGG